MKLNENLKIAFEEEPIVPNESIELNDVYKSFEYQEYYTQLIIKEHTFSRCNF